MKHLFASLLTVVCFATHAQFPSIPYNPDENGDGLIGVVDLQGLLANYGSEFSSAIVSEDGESAIVYMGQMAYPHCKRNCDELPGFWSLPEMEDLVPVWEDVYTTNDLRYTWLKSPFDDHNMSAFRSDDSAFINGHYVFKTTIPAWDYRCYCTAKQLPRVEYSYCMTTTETYNTLVGQGGYAEHFQSCCDDKVDNGWYPLGGISKGGSNDGAQAFWRWAE